MAWNNTAVTTAGNALLQRVLAGEKLHLDYAAGGSGTVDTASLMAQTTLINQQQMFNIVGLSKVANGQKVNIQILNAELKTGYIMQQIGIWAHIGTEEPLLFAVLQDEKGIDIPSEYEVGDFALNFYAVIDFSNQSEFQITVDPSALVTHATLLDEMSKKANLQHEHISSEITGLSKVATSGKYTDLSEIPTVINTPEEGSLALITSGGVYEVVKLLATKEQELKIQIDDNEQKSSKDILTLAQKVDKEERIIYDLAMDTSTNEITNCDDVAENLYNDLTSGKNIEIRVNNGTYNYVAMITDRDKGFFSVWAPRWQRIYSWRCSSDSILFWKEQYISDDTILELKTSGIWTYRKWASGVAECWARFGFWNETISNDQIKRFHCNMPFPFEFVGVPAVFAVASSIPDNELTNGYPDFNVINAVASTTQLQTVSIIGYTQSVTITEGFVSIHVNGRWK